MAKAGTIWPSVGRSYNSRSTAMEIGPIFHTTLFFSLPLCCPSWSLSFSSARGFVCSIVCRRLRRFVVVVSRWPPSSVLIFQFPSSIASSSSCSFQLFFGCIFRFQWNPSSNPYLGVKIEDRRCWREGLSWCFYRLCYSCGCLLLCSSLVVVCYFLLSSSSVAVFTLLPTASDFLSSFSAFCPSKVEALASTQVRNRWPILSLSSNRY